MPKSIVVDPKEVRKPDLLKIKDIPLNQYKGDFKKELERYGKEKLVRIWYDMATIREFESMLNTLRPREPGTVLSTTTRVRPIFPWGRRPLRWASA